MTTRSRCLISLAAVAALVLVACGGGGGGGGNRTPSGIDRGGRTIAQGPISGFGSIFVNGVEYSTSSATVTIDDQPGTESDLRVGQYVRVEGALDANGTTGTATRVVYADDVEGPVQSIDLANGRMVVVGQVVQTGTGTSFDPSIAPNDLSGLAVGDRVEVSGAVRSTGEIDATRIERKAASSSVEVKGVVSAVDTGLRRFAIGAQTVDYSAATLDGFASGQPVNGDLVEAQGTMASSGVLLASRVQKESGSTPGASDDKADYDGLITRFVSPVDWDVSGQRVTTSSATRYDGGTAADLALDVQVEVEGSFDSSGRIVATRVEFHKDAEIEISANVDSVNLASSTVVVLGRTVRTDSLTRFEDHSSAGVVQFGLDDLHVGDYVEVRAINEGTGLRATIVERRDAQASAELVGVATSVVQPNFVVAGVTVTTDAATEFRDIQGVPISADAFFAAADGQMVKVRGTLAGSTLRAERAELEN